MSIVNLFLSIIAICAIIFTALIGYKFWQKKIYIWFVGYMKWLLDYKSRHVQTDKQIHVMFLVVDHFEPGTRGADKKTSDMRFETWFKKYPELARKHRDSYGKFPQHVFFLPPHYLTHEYMVKLSELAYYGFGEIEFHLHHEGDSSETLTKKINETLEKYSRYGALITAEKKPRKTYGFVHGDWALDNSRGGRFCGVNNELTILKETGCYADFTMPSLLESQSKKVNSIYYAKDDPEKPKSYDEGIDVEVGEKQSGDLMLVEGPIGFNLKDWRHKYFPSLEDSELIKENPPFSKRIDHWIRCSIHVKGKPEWIFVKVHCHGGPEQDHYTLLGEPTEQMYQYIESKYNDGKKYILHHVSTREAYNIIKAAEAGKTGDPDEFRDYIIPPYANQVIKTNAQYTLKTWAENEIIIEKIEAENLCCFEFRSEVLQGLKAEIESLEFKLENEKKRASLRLSGTGKGEVILCTPYRIKEISNAKIDRAEAGEKGFVSYLSFEIAGKTHEINAGWGGEEE